MEIDALRETVTAAQQEFDMAVAFHEVWKPAAYDKDLHNRFGRSYASQAFLITRTALRREMVLALMRLWDTSNQSIRMPTVVRAALGGKERKGVIDALAAKRVSPVDFDLSDRMKADLEKRAREIIELLKKYMKGGSHQAVFDNLLDLRNKRLAHRQRALATPTRENIDEEIEEFYQDSSKLIRTLLGLVNAMAYDPEDTAKVYRHYSSHFWSGTRGEQTEGHPNYRLTR